MLEILDSLIATIAVVLVLSLIVQAIQQIIKQAWSFKSKYMEQELFAMFLQAKTVSAQSYFQSNLFKRSLNTLWNFLVPARLEFKSTVADTKNKNLVALLDELKAKLGAIGYSDISLLEKMTKEEFVRLLQQIQVESATIVPEVVTKAIDDAKQWYDHMLEAFQEHYESRMKMWSYAISFAVVVGLNSNIFDIYNEFALNKTLRESAVKMADQLAKIPRDTLIRGDSIAGKDSLRIDSVARKAIERHLSDINEYVSNKSFKIMRWNVSDSLIKAGSIVRGYPEKDTTLTFIGDSVIRAGSIRKQWPKNDISLTIIRDSLVKAGKSGKGIPEKDSTITIIAQSVIKAGSIDKGFPSQEIKISMRDSTVNSESKIRIGSLTLKTGCITPPGKIFLQYLMGRAPIHFGRLVGYDAPCGTRRAILVRSSEDSHGAKRELKE
jgi:hypothetical protein